MGNLSPEERITFLSWCNADFEAELHLEIEKEPNKKGYFKKSIWGGKSKSSAFEEETFDYIDTIYLLLALTLMTLKQVLLQMGKILLLQLIIKK